MLSALYYPHISIKDSKLIKNALLLWDQVEYLAPWSDIEPYHSDRKVKKALELLAKPYVPSSKEKKLAHNAIVELANSQLPDWFFFEKLSPEFTYGIYDMKFSPETWYVLRKSKLAKANDSNTGFITSTSFGLTMMSILAECCAGTQKHMITDEIDSYEALNRYLIEVNGGELVSLPLNSDYERLVTITLKIIDTSNIDISRLIALRKKENESGGSYIRELRHRYLQKIRSCAEHISKEATNDSDKLEIERVFEQEMKDDLDALKEELKLEAKKVILSKEMAVTVLLGAGTTITPASGILSIGALINRGVNYRAARIKTLKEHSMSWLYISPKFQVF